MAKTAYIFIQNYAKIIILAVILLIFLLIKIGKWISKNKVKKFSKEEYESIKKHVRIAWIEDKRGTIPLKELEDDLFSIKHIRRVSQEDLSALESSSYEIVILDIKGVVPKRLIDGDGFGLLERIKQKSPQTYVLVCTGEMYGAKEAKILQQADDLLANPISYTAIKDKLEKIIKIRFFYREELDKIFRRISPSIPLNKQPKVFELIEMTCSSEMSTDALKSNLDSLRIATGCVRDILQSLEKILSL